MATSKVQLQHPEQFKFTNPDGWPKWKRRFEQFRTASGLTAAPAAQQISTLLYCLGEEAEDVLTSTNITEDERKDYDQVLAKLDGYFKVRVNQTLERAKFNQRCQKEGETADQYITTLYGLVETCNYGAMRDEMICDKLVVGIRDKALAEKLQMDATLTLETAKKKIRQQEAMQDRRKELQTSGGQDSKEASLHDVASRRKRGGSRGGPDKHQRADQKTASTKFKSKCARCGQGPHPTGDTCPARSTTCRKCGRKGHYTRLCFTKNPSARELSLDGAFIGSMDITTPTSWTVDTMIKNKTVRFKVDTGAEVTAVSEETYKGLKVTLQKATRIVYGPAKQKLDILGQFVERISYKDKSSQQTVFVIRGLKSNLLGLPAISSLEIVKRLDNVEPQKDLKEQMMEQFPTVFSGLGTLGEDYDICLKEGAVPHCVYAPRSVPIPLREKTQEELNKMEAMGVISKVSEPTQWCSGMVVVKKKSGDVRICVDLQKLNESVLREVYPLPKVEEILAQLAGATVFSKLDANSGFWQIPLSEKSKHLTTFVTPSGRYCFNKLPFGITSAPELFQKRMSHILEGLPGVLCLIDDVLIFGKTQEEHNANLLAALKRLKAAHVTLNSKKCEFSKLSVHYLGHVIDRNGIRPDPAKLQAVINMEPPQSVSDVRRFMGMVNQMGKFSPRLAELGQPLRELLSSKTVWTWGPAQERAFSNIKEELTRPTVLALYDPKAKTKISADASSYGLGAVLLQQNSDAWKPVAYASRSLNETERRYAQIEKEALAATWACERFRDYVLGKEIEIETDHKPLVPLLSNKRLDGLPPRVLRFRLRLDNYCYHIRHVPGKLLYVADTLSRAPVGNEDVCSMELGDEVEAFISGMIQPSIDQPSLDLYRSGQAVDTICSKAMEYCNSGWPRKNQIPPDLIPYWKLRDSLTIYNDLLLFNERIVIPSSMRADVLQKLHEGHQGIERCRTRARESVWWPNLSNQIKETVQNCPDCAKLLKQRKEPLLGTPLPEFPWKVIGTDLFELDKKHYLLVVDYYSRYPEVVTLKSTTSSAIIECLKSIFSRHGIPEILRSDNGPQYSSAEFSQFASTYGFKHVTSSPMYPQSNGQAERTVQTVKRLLKHSNDPYLSLMSYRATPLPWCGFSPTELLMGRKIRTTVPLTSKQLTPQWPYLQEFRRLDNLHRSREKENYDRGHGVRNLPDIPDNTDVWITTESDPIAGKVVTSADAPRSYIVETPTGEVRRNRSQLTVRRGDSTPGEKVQPFPPTSQQQQEPNPEQASPPAPPKLPTPNRIMTRSRTGTVIKPRKL